MIVAIVLVIVLIIFIAENTRSVEISFFGVHGHTPVAVALLASAVVGALIVLIVGIGRIAQLRHTARANRAIASAPAVEPAPPAATVPVEASPGVAADEVGRGSHVRHDDAP